MSAWFKYEVTFDWDYKRWIVEKWDSNSIHAKSITMLLNYNGIAEAAAPSLVSLKTVAKCCSISAGRDVFASVASSTNLWKACSNCICGSCVASRSRSGRNVSCTCCIETASRPYAIAYVQSVGKEKVRLWRLMRLFHWTYKVMTVLESLWTLGAFERSLTFR